MLPQRGYVVVVPTELLTKRARETVGCVDSLRVGIVIAKYGKNWAPNVLLEKIVDTKLSILSIRTRELVLRVMGYEISGIDCPCNRGIAVRPSQGRNSLKSSQPKVIGCVTLERTIEGRGYSYLSDGFPGSVNIRSATQA